MDAHKRFMKHCTTEVSLLLSLESSNGFSLSNLIDGFNHDIWMIEQLIWPLQNLETVHTILCSFYKQKIHADHDGYTKLMYEVYSDLFKKIDVNLVQKALYTQELNVDASSLVLDILILQMVLYYDVPTIINKLNTLQDLIHLHIDKDSDLDGLNILDIKLMDCYMDSLLLHQKSSGLIRLPDETVGAPFRRNVNIWFRLKGSRKGHLLSVVLPKLIKVVDDNENSAFIFNSIFLMGGDQRNILSILCLTADVWFPIESDYDKQLIERSMDESLWLVLLKGLSSPVLQERKQALYIIKRVVDFTNKHDTQDFELGNDRDIGPLVCIGNDFQQDSLKKNVNNFFVILEALEEKQKCLVTSIFPLLQHMCKKTFDEENYKTGLHIMWIRCVFLRILQHDDNAIVRWGLLNAFTVDLELYNDEFLDKVLDVLNSAYLYDNDINEAEPTVVKELTKLLNNAEMTSNDLITRFMVKASKMTWCSVALFYIIHTLSMVKKVGSVWRKVELDAVKSLAEISLSMHCPILRIGSQTELLEAMTHFTTESLDLMAIANTLSTFSTSEALIRGQLSWKRISTWLSKIVKVDEAVSFLEKICGQLADENVQNDLSMKIFSLIIMLFHDGHLILNSKLCPGLTVLRNLLNCLIGADSRPYANNELRNKSIELIYYLLDFTSSTDCILRELISNYANAILQFIFKKLRKVSDEVFVNDINTYVLVTQQFFTTESSIIAKREVLNYIDKFVSESHNIIEDEEDGNNVQRYFGIKILCSCLKVTSTKVKNYIFIGPLYDTYKISMKQSSGDRAIADRTGNENENLKARIEVEYYKFVAELFYEYVKDEPADEWIPDIDWIEQVSYLIKVGRKDIFVPVVGMLSQIFYKDAVKATDMNNFKSTIKLCWSLILESNECWLATEEMINLIFSSPFLDCKETKALTIEFTCEMVVKADQIPGLSIILLNGLKRVKGEHLYNFYEAVLACLFHGAVLHHDQKIELQARSYVLDSYQEVYPNYLSNMNVNINAATRAHAITLLHRMITDDPTHAAPLLPLIGRKFNESQNKHYFEDSQMHRLNNRIMQVLLVLQPVLENGDIESLRTLVCDDIFTESSQPSIRIMQEWLLIRIYLKNETLRAKIYDLFDQGKEKCAGSLCSIISIVYHVARLLPSESPLDKSNFIYLAFDYITPCCMAPQFDVRLYAQVVISKLYDLATELSYSAVTEKYKGLYDALTKIFENTELIKNSNKLRDDFYFTVFNPIEDYSLQTLFYELPRLSDVSSDEYISPQMFEKFGFKESNSHPLKLSNLKSDISETQASAHMSKSSGSVRSVVDDIDGSTDHTNDIQKTFIPWKSMTFNEDEFYEISKTFVTSQKASIKGSDIILIASLLDNLPNLGGLSRTCEALGVQEFVVSSIKHTEDKEFGSITNSAAKLITIKEIKPQQLQHYLLKKKNAGYRLVGAEPTVNSTSLMDMKFDKKTALLLGNEKAGIPANLMLLLDQCVEIPHLGVVTSLNVPATGAICLWEYFKQHHSP